MLAELQEIADAAIAAVDGETAAAAAVAEPAVAAALAGAERAFSVSVGKAAPAMHHGLRRGGVRWSGGIVVAERAGVAVDGGGYVAGGHPMPTDASVAAAQAVLGFLGRQALTAADAVVFCISGGTSALIALPVAGIDLADLRAINDALLRSGVGIDGINAVRRMLSATHNGGLAAAASPARCFGFLVNDVPGAPLDVIGSGPTFAARDTGDHAARLIERHVAEPTRSRALAAVSDRRRRLPQAVAVTNLEVAGPDRALAAARRAAAAVGLDCEVMSEPMVGPVGRSADRMAAAVAEWRRLSISDVCLVAAGEVAVEVAGSGQGGRCQQFAWEMARRLDGAAGAVFLGQASDGRDHVAGVGGAWADDTSMGRLTALGLSWEAIAAENDAHRGLEALGQLLPGRATGTNVSDIYLVGLG